jgi:hypothetical protein
MAAFCGPKLNSIKGTIGKPVDCEIKIINEEGVLGSNEKENC